MREALHAEPVNKIGTWTLCTTRINYTRDNAEYSMIPIHKRLTKEYGTCPRAPPPRNPKHLEHPHAEYSMIPIHKGLMWEHATCCLLLHMCAVVCVCAIPPSP